MVLKPSTCCEKVSLNVRSEGAGTTPHRIDDLVKFTLAPCCDHRKSDLGDMSATWGFKGWCAVSGTAIFSALACKNGMILRSHDEATDFQPHDTNAIKICNRLKSVPPSAQPSLYVCCFLFFLSSRFSLTAVDVEFELDSVQIPRSCQRMNVLFLAFYHLTRNTKWVSFASK